MEKTIFRRKTIERMSSPEQLADYLRVTNPGLWMVFAAVILLLIGIFSWLAVGTIETTAPVTVIVEDHTAQVVPASSGALAAGMTLRIDGQEFTLTEAGEDEYGRSIGTAAVDLPDGTYEGDIVTDQIHPVDYVLTSR